MRAYRKISLQKLVGFLLVVGIAGVTIYILRDLGILSRTRYFNEDEFAYLSWAYQAFAGKRPYLDFYHITPPGFLLILRPVFAIGVGTIEPILRARALSLGLFIFLSVSLGMLFYQVRKSWIAVLVPLILLFLPLPSDKFFEIRPDTSAMVVLVVGIMAQIWWMDQVRFQKRAAFVSGLFYGSALLILQKVLPNLVIAGLVGTLWLFWQIRKKRIKLFAPVILWFVIGGLLLPILFFGWAISTGRPDVVWFSLTQLPMEVSKLGTIYNAGVSQFFFPNDIYYGTFGYHIGYWLSLLIWSLGWMFACVRFVSVGRNTDHTSVFSELLLTGMALVSMIFYLFITPLKFAQYLISPAVFMVFFFVDGIDELWQWARKCQLFTLVFFCGMMLFLLGIVNGFQLVVNPKKLWKNDALFNGLTQIYHEVPKNEPVLDLVGAMYFYPQPYPVCCVPFGQYQQFLSHPDPSVIEALETTKTKYIYQGTVKRAGTLLKIDQTYISRNFHSVGDGQLLSR